MMQCTNNSIDWTDSNNMTIWVFGEEGQAKDFGVRFAGDFYVGVLLPYFKKTEHIFTSWQHNADFRKPRRCNVRFFPARPNGKQGLATS